MNLELLDPFQQEEVPDIIKSYLEERGNVLTCAFNRRGNYIAGGCSDGKCYIWDFETTGIIREFIGHEDKITSICWSRDSHYVLSSSKDKSCMIWNSITGEQVCKLNFDTPIKNSCFHPKIKTLILVCPQKRLPVLVDISHLNEDGGEEIRTLVQLDREEVAAKTDYQACFSRYGEKIYFGSSKGNIYVYDLEKQMSIESLKINTGSSTIKNIHISKKGRDLLVNSSDRQIRVFTIKENGEIELQHRFQDPVNQIQWVQCCFSPNSEYVIGAADTKPYKIYIWDKEDGNLIRILEGPQEQLVDLAWHPYRRVIVTVPKNSQIAVWVTTYQENWSAFAPDFQELEENIEYVEKENEFDIINESLIEEENKKKKEEEEEEDVDVVNIQRVIYNSDSDSSDEELFFIPVTPDIVNMEKDEEDDGGNGNGIGNGNDGGHDNGNGNRGENHPEDTIIEDQDVDMPNTNSHHPQHHPQHHPHSQHHHPHPHPYPNSSHQHQHQHHQQHHNIHNNSSHYTNSPMDTNSDSNFSD